MDQAPVTVARRSSAVRSASPWRLAVGLSLVLSLVAFAVGFGRTARHVLDGSWVGDFPNYYFSGRHVLERTSPYRLLNTEVRDDLGLAYMEKYPADPPPTLILLAPLALLPFRVAWFVMAGASAGLLVGVMWGTCRHVGLDRLHTAAIAAFALVTYPGRALLHFGHMEAWVLLSGYLGWRALAQHREPAGGCWWALATGLKLFPGTWLVGLVAARRWSAVPAVAITGLILALGSVVVIGLEPCVFFVTRVVAQSRDWAEAVGNLSLLGLGGTLGGPTVGWLLEVGVGGWLVARFLARPGGADRMWCAGTALALLLSPLTWVFYYTLAFPSLVVLAARLSSRSTWVGVRFAILTGVITLWPAFVDTGYEPLTRLSVAARPAALVLLFLWLLSALPDDDPIEAAPGPRVPLVRLEAGTGP